MYIGIDLALRKTGIVILDKDGSLNFFSIVFSDPKTVNDEDLLLHNKTKIWSAMPHRYRKADVALEGLSYNSVSADHDLISANHWITRMTLKEFSNLTVNIFPPKAWQKSIVTKEFLLTLAPDYPIVRAKKGLKLTKEQVSANSKSKLAIRKASKEKILNSIPKDIVAKFEAYVATNKLSKDAIYDLTDAYCLAQHLRSELVK